MSKVKYWNPFLFAILSIFSLIFFSGCNAPKKDLESFNKYLKEFDYVNSAAFAEKKICKGKNPKGEDLLWALQLGTVERFQRDYTKSTESFDKAEEMLKFYDEQSRITDVISSTVASDNLIPYRGEEYDGIMVNTYKALNFMVEGKTDLARVEFNRALDRQRRAKEKFSEEISKIESELEHNQQSSLSRSNVENPRVHELLVQKYPNLYNFEAYPDFVNPFTTYLAGIYFNLVGDHSKAIDLLKESYGMVQDNTYIAEDLAMTEEILEGNGELKDMVWLIFENGLGPVREEFRIDLPLFVATSRIQYVGIALPRLEFREKAHSYLVAETDGERYQTQLVSDIDKVVQTEFSKDYTGILTRAIMSATVKAAAQYAITEQNSGSGAAIASIAMATYSFLSTAADVRIWTSLPKNFQVARFKKPKDGKLTITPSGPILLDIDIPECNNALVYIRIITDQAMPIYEVMTF